MSLAIFALLAVQKGPDDWILEDLAPPTRAERFGFSTRQIARMSFKEWSSYGNRLPIDRGREVYAAVLRTETRQEALRYPLRTRQTLEHVRNASLLLGRACIELENELGGGGTWGTHATVRMQIDSELLVRNLLRRRVTKKVSPTDLARASLLIDRCRKLKAPRPTVLESPIRLDRLHATTERVVRYRRTFEALKARYHVGARNHFDAFVVEWTTRYFSARGSDKVILP